MEAAMAVRAGLAGEGICGVHPERLADEVIDHVKLFAPIDGEEPAARALTLCPGTAYDRSPCGTGTSAKLAVLHAKGELGIGEWFVAESVLGTRFRARVVSEVQVGGLPAIVPEIEGSAWITGMPVFVFDPDDPCRFGI
jgi:proline racemase